MTKITSENQFKIQNVIVTITSKKWLINIKKSEPNATIIYLKLRNFILFRRRLRTRVIGKLDRCWLRKYCASITERSSQPASKRRKRKKCVETTPTQKSDRIFFESAIKLQWQRNRYKNVAPPRPVWPDIGITSSPKISKSCPNCSHSCFYFAIIWCF